MDLGRIRIGDEAALPGSRTVHSTSQPRLRHPTNGTVYLRSLKASRIVEAEGAFYSGAGMLADCQKKE